MSIIAKKIKINRYLNLRSSRTLTVDAYLKSKYSRTMHFIIIYNLIKYRIIKYFYIDYFFLFIKLQLEFNFN